MQLTDIDADMFTDIISLDKTRKKIMIHLFDSANSNYYQKIEFKPNECETITNVAVGRSAKTLRLFVTCYDAAHKTIMRMYDRNLNEELPAE